MALVKPDANGKCKIKSKLCTKNTTSHPQTIRFHILSPEGNFDIDAGDGGGGGDRLGRKSQQISTNQFVRKLFTLLGHFQQIQKAYL